ncbi:hypothetical protein [Pseudomonas sp. stari2]|uniref:hypothetical protein n=1 Tax=Pseudomonas sp. Stari2 TaxID=2954814 RepID=UPI00345C9ACF
MQRIVILGNAGSGKSTLARISRQAAEKKIDRKFLTFLKFVWTFDRDYRPGIDNVRQSIGPEIPVVQLRDKRQISTFLDRLCTTPQVSQRQTPVQNTQR